MNSVFSKLFLLFSLVSQEALAMNQGSLFNPFLSPFFDSEAIQRQAQMEAMIMSGGMMSGGMMPGGMMPGGMMPGGIISAADLLAHQMWQTHFDSEDYIVNGMKFTEGFRHDPEKSGLWALHQKLIGDSISYLSSVSGESAEQIRTRLARRAGVTDQPISFDADLNSVRAVFQGAQSSVEPVAAASSIRTQSRVTSSSESRAAERGSGIPGFRSQVQSEAQRAPLQATVRTPLRPGPEVQRLNSTAGGGQVRGTESGSYPVLSRMVTRDPKTCVLIEDARAQKENKLRLSRVPIAAGMDRNQDHLRAMAELRRIQSLGKPRGEYGVNFEVIGSDPYLQFHSIDLVQFFPEDLGENEVQLMLREFARLRDLHDFGEQISGVVRNLLPIPNDSSGIRQSKQIALKRLFRLFEVARSQTQRGEPGQQAETPLADLGLNLLANAGRCIDGIQNGLTDIERLAIPNENRDTAGEFISRVLTDEKMEFVKKFSELKPDDAEFKTTVVQLLQQRMLYSLGLRGNEAQIRYPHLAHGDDEALQPKEVMTRFLTGGEVRLASESSTPLVLRPYSVRAMVEALHQARERSFINGSGTAPLKPREGRPIFSNEMLARVCELDPVLNEKWSTFLEDLEVENEFFKKRKEGQNDANIQIKPQFWLYLLEKYSYIVR